MRRLFGLLILVSLAAGLAGCAGPNAGSGLYSVTAILGGRHTFGERVTLPGDVYVLAGELNIEPGASIDGALRVMDGQVSVGGAVGGDVSLLGGTLVLEPTARVQGAVQVAGGTLQRSPQAGIGRGVQVEPEAALAGRANPGASPAGRLLSGLAQALLAGALASLLARYLTRPLARVSDVIVHHWLVAAAMGILAGCIALVMLVLIAFTIVLLPLSFVGAFALLMAVVYGWAGFGMAIGGLLGRRLTPRLGLAWRAFLGTLIFMVASGLLQMIPLIGGLLPLLAAAVGFGAVILTRFGLRTFVPAVDQAPEWLPPDR